MTEVFMAETGLEPDNYQLTEEALKTERQYLAGEVTRDPNKVSHDKVDALVKVHIAIQALEEVKRTGGPLERAEPSYQAFAI